MRIQELTAARDKAIVELEEKQAVQVTDSGLLVFHENAGQEYQPEMDFEIGTILSLGVGAWDGVAEGDRVMVRGGSGGKAGADIGHAFGRKVDEVVVVGVDEVICVLEG